MNDLFSPPSLEDLIRLLKAWRFWLMTALAGALIGAAVYVIAPPPYRARATVNVDFNLEQAWPQNTDRQDFYYLERETRKLEEIAWSDSVLKVVADDHGTSVSELRSGILLLSQPSEAGWHFYAEDQNRQRAGQIASTWAKAFAGDAKKQIGASDGLNSFIRLEVTQSADLPMERAVSIGAYLLAGALTGMSLGGLGVLFLKPNPGGTRTFSSPAPARKDAQKKGRAGKKK